MIAKMDTPDRFVTDLSRARIGQCVNPYARAHQRPDLDRTDAAARREANLRDYLASRDHSPLLLVGEAPGYRGCRFSGIPFTSERSLPSDRWSSRHPVGWQEPSATIVHRVLGDLGLAESALLWNALPLHPTGSTPLSNRRPTADELRVGAQWLHRLIALVRPRAVIAVGGAAARVLPAVPVIRHPSYGGASAFRAQFAAWIGTKAPSPAVGRQRR